jgi:hypothetical protein
MHWIYQNLPITELPPNTVGFVYEITNLTNNKKYIGKKIAHFAKTTYKMVLLKNGKKKRKSIKSSIDSDWATYYGSSKALLSDVELLGSAQFTREILHFCTSKAHLSYMELKEQVERNVLYDPNYYNMWISAKIGKLI